MAYDTTGATVGAAGHDAATLVAAFITAGVIDSEDAAFETFVSLRNSILADSLEVQGVTALTQGTKATPISSAPSAGGSGGDFGDVEFKGGKHAGKSIADVYAEAPDYLEWIAGNDSYKNDFMRTRITSFLAAKAA